MLIATIRNQEIQTVDIEGESLEDIQTQLTALCPAGFELISAPVAMIKGSTKMVSTGTFMRRDEFREVEGATLEAIRAQTPDGWQPLHVRVI